MTSIEQLERMLDKEGALVVSTYPNIKVLDSIKKKINSIVQHGEHVLVLKGYTSNNINKIRPQDNVFLNQTHIRDPFYEGASHYCSIYELIALIRDSIYSEWLSKVKLILIESGEDIFYEPNIWETAFYLLQEKFVSLDINLLPNLLILTKPRRAIEPALKEALPLYDAKLKNETKYWRETSYKITKSEVKKHWWTIWSSCKSIDYANQLYPNTNADIGIIAPLAQFAGRWGVSKDYNLAVATYKSGEKDRLENLTKVTNNGILYRIQDNISWQIFSKHQRFNGAVTIYNNDGNPWLSLKNIAYSLPNLTISNVIAKQTMLLEYFLDNGHCYATVPELPLSPKVQRNSPYNAVLVLLQRLKYSRYLSLTNISYILSRINFDGIIKNESLFQNDSFGRLKALVALYFGDDVAEKLQLTLISKWQKEQRDYAQQALVSLNGGDLNISLPWLQPVQILDGNNLFATILKDHVYQSYWAGKQVLFYGKVFKVDTIDLDNNTISVSHKGDVKLIDYRIDKIVNILQSPDEWHKVKSLSSTVTFSNQRQLVIDSYVLEYSVECGNNVVSNDSLWREPSTITSLEHPLNKRNYKFGRALRVQLLDENHQSLLTDKSAITLSAWLNESAVTLLPEIHTFFISAPQLRSKNSRPKNRITDICIPDLNMATSDNQKNCVWVFEDSHTDLGIINTIYENISQILDLCYDWLVWFLEGSETISDPDSNSIPLAEKVFLENMRYPSKNWFSYGDVEVDTAIDLKDLKNAIDNMYGQNHRFEHTERRVRVERNIDKYRLIDGDSSLIYECDICAKTIEDNENNQTLSDGRISCENCYENGVTEESQVKKLYNNLVLDFYNNKHGILDFGSLDIQLVNQTIISQEQQKNFIPTSRFDSRTIGLAINKGNVDSATSLNGTKYTVMLESGHSIESTASTLVHELCHIWQYQNINYQKLEREHDKYIIEGHAVWAAESFLNYVVENPYNKFDNDRLALAQINNDNLKSSNTIYGKGYKLLMVKLGSKDKSAFHWVVKNFPKQSH